MSSPWRSGPKIGGLDALPEIAKLAEEVLTVEQLKRADEMAFTLLSRRKQRRQVRWELVRMVPLKPTRPLMYLKPLAYIDETTFDYLDCISGECKNIRLFVSNIKEKTKCYEENRMRHENQA